MAAIILVIAAGVTTTTSPLTAPLYLLQSAEAFMDPNTLKTEPKAPPVISGNNIYIVWWTDKGTPNTNGEVMFRASNDGGTTFGDKMNLSNTPTADSVDAEIAADGATVMVTWWERNQTSNTPIARMSTDGGETFGPILRLGMNGTLILKKEQREEETQRKKKQLEEQKQQSSSRHFFAKSTIIHFYLAATTTTITLLFAIV
ncbi:MAG: hypothetical protein M3299_14540 [Thermoproteota archaeon]|nr:hypothetical protein [Thermoproteota archaeon]